MLVRPLSGTVHALGLPSTWAAAPLVGPRALHVWAVGHGSSPSGLQCQANLGRPAHHTRPALPGHAGDRVPHHGSYISSGNFFFVIRTNTELPHRVASGALQQGAAVTPGL